MWRVLEWSAAHGSNENENENLLIPAVQHDVYHRITFKNKIDLRLT